MPTRSHFLLFPRLIILTALFLLSHPITPSLAGTYISSAHGGSSNAASGKGVVRLAGTISPGNCAHCHEQHASIGGVEPAPVKPGASNYLLFADLAGNVMCNYCHDSSAKNGADNIAAQFSISKTHKHDPSSATPVLCNDCHDSHVAQKINHIEAQNGGNVVFAGSPLLSVAGVSVTWGTPGAPIAGSENLNNGTLSPLDPVTMEYQLCLKCHGGQTATYPLLADLRGQFNPNNYSVHPVTTTGNWKNAYLRDTVPSPLVFPWSDNKNAKMYCSDCHGSENSSNPQEPAGPHGSTNVYMLKLAGPGATLDNLCLRCHVNPALGSAWANGLSRDHRYPQHQYPTNTMGCLACHGGIGGALASNVHGANYVWPNEGANSGRQSKAFLVGGLITKNYFIGALDASPNRRCSASCHTLDGGTGYAY